MWPEAGRFGVKPLATSLRRQIFSSPWRGAGLTAATVVGTGVLRALAAQAGAAHPVPVDVVFGAAQVWVNCATVLAEELLEKTAARVPDGAARVLFLALTALLPGCADAPLVAGTGLSAYSALAPSNGLITKSNVHVDKAEVLAAKTINIIPARFPATVAPKFSAQQRDLVSNAVDRALCVSLSRRFVVVGPNQPADLTVRAAVTRVSGTNEIAAGASVATSIAMSFVETAVPIPTPRIPLGMGAISIEAEALDPKGKQRAAMVWAKGANMMFSSARMSKASDAYDLAAAFGADFAQLLIKGESPFKGSGIGIDLPTWQGIRSAMGLPAKYAACESFGRSPGLVGVVADQVGLPPEWIDKGRTNGFADPAAPKRRTADLIDGSPGGR
ncbi:DUF3313 domain-containing protein [Acuticoccus kandeliae]|uniref:DUF3313 domain-containing protein n=1 Tax=Acuticoccus kandeliae TaxID=2073160 RepID=UPI00196B2C4D|nr:DUF3313 domain-containing protein [Acuticoccus kandeliae]